MDKERSNKIMIIFALVAVVIISISLLFVAISQHAQVAESDSNTTANQVDENSTQENTAVSEEPKLSVSDTIKKECAKSGKQGTVLYIFKDYVENSLSAKKKYGGSCWHVGGALFRGVKKDSIFLPDDAGEVRDAYIVELVYKEVNEDMDLYQISRQHTIATCIIDQSNEEEQNNVADLKADNEIAVEGTIVGFEDSAAGLAIYPCRIVK